MRSSNDGLLGNTQSWRETWDRRDELINDTSSAARLLGGSEEQSSLAAYERCIAIFLGLAAAGGGVTLAALSTHYENVQVSISNHLGKFQM